MRRHLALPVVIGLSIWVPGACSAPSPDQSPGTEGRLAIGVAPLDLPGIGFACYDIAVTNDQGQPVWSRGTVGLSFADGDNSTLCSTRFGNGAGGDIAYVGPCDATDSNPDDGGAAMHAVTLWLDGLYDADGGLLDDYQDPCPAPGGCSVQASCIENADVPVRFNLTIMRQANQGFFDIAVNFNSIYCSAKLDCRDAFLHRQGQRAETAVIAFACTSGPAAAGGSAPDTVLYLSDVTMRCGEAPDETVTVLPVGGPEGQQGPVAPHVFQWARYHDTEAFPSLQKCAWNHAVGLDLTAIGQQRCTISLTGTASPGPFPVDTIPADSVYPVIQWDVEVVDAGAICGEHPLNGPGSQVVTTYSGGATPHPAFEARFQCGQAPVRLEAPFLPFAGPDAISWQTVNDGGQTLFIVEAGGESSEPIALPEGYVPTGSAFIEQE